MNTREWALIVFTILAQLSVGMLLTLLIVRTYITRKSGVEQAARLTDMPFYAVAVLMILALVASLFHLGKVIHVIGAVPNLATSWMSREVVFSVTFMILVVVFCFLEWRKIGSEGLRATLGWISALVGVILLVCMSMTYMLPAEPAWNTLATPILFFVTSLLLGVLGSAVGLIVNPVKLQGKQDAALTGVLQWIAISAIFLMGIEFLVTPLYMAYLSTQGTAALHSLSLMVSTYGWALFIRLTLVFIGAGLLGTYLFRDASEASKEQMLAKLAYSAFVLVLVSEVLGRFMFYATRYRIGV